MQLEIVMNDLFKSIFRMEERKRGFLKIISNFIIDKKRNANS